MSQFVYRGPLAPDSPLFRGRQTELMRLEQLCQGEVQSYAIIYAGRQMGKTSLLYRLAVRLASLARTAHIDFQNIPRASTEEALGYIAQCISEAVPELSDHLPVSNTSRLRQFLSNAIGVLPERRLVLLLEELGVLSREVRNDLANVIRSLFTNRFDPARRALGRLLVVIAGSIELYELAATEVSTLHNICESFYLPDLDEVDGVGLIAETLTELGLPPDKSLALGEAVHAYVGGHPYLTQRLGALLEDIQNKGQVLDVKHVDDALEELLAGDPLLSHLYRALQENNYRPAVKSLLKDQVRFSRHVQDMARLELLGLAKESGGLWQVRNLLLERALHDWLGLRQHNPTGGNLAASVVALCTADGAVVGTGFLLDDHLIISCAHVVLTAGNGPVNTIKARFHVTGDLSEARVVADHWRSPDSDDIAVLRLDAELPEGVVPVKLGESASCEGHLFRAFGYPSMGDIEGLWATGKIEGLVSEDGRQLLQLNSQNLAQGMSGGPVLDETTRRVVGMITSVIHPDATTKHRDTAFATPTETLWQVCPELR